jgi:Putative prokaryotic signal transducing protein
MIEVLRTNSVVRLDYAMVLLMRAGCHPFMADRFMASAEGGISAFERRILVPDHYAAIAREALKELDEPPDPDLLAEGDWDEEPT